jgi:hypothetical protein
VSPYSADYAADDRPWRPGDKEARSRAKRRANGVGSRVGGREGDKCPRQKTPRFGSSALSSTSSLTRRKFQKHTIVAIRRRFLPRALAGSREKCWGDRSLFVCPNCDALYELGRVLTTPPCTVLPPKADIAG